MKIAVIYGGKSGEHEVSLVSAASIVRNINTAKHDIILIGIAKSGKWFLQNETECERVRADAHAALTVAEDADALVSIVPGGGTEGLRTKKGTLPVDVVFSVLHGTYGEDGTIQGLLDMTGIPYTGCSTASSALTMDKEKTKQIWRESRLPVLPHVCLKQRDRVNGNGESLQKLMRQAETEFGYPLFVKPCGTGSSVGASKVSKETELEAAVAEAFRWDDKILIEPAIDAREIECSVTGNSVSGGEVTAYTPGEIKPSHTFYDYDAKYTDPNGAKLCIPADLSAEQLDVVRKTAVKAYETLDCSGLSRVDFFIDRKTGNLYLNEINTMPGFTSISMFPKMCEAAGLSYADLVELIITEGLDRYKARRALKTSRN
ncbi:D-alanine--D-alanine ligase family protein [Treponema brennaborense]|uniref:D-alanine--D-alanine ligase n=1 Tax=Treponema brennaborense (strain DSM 12168 / CIP 105900 / DD5/3) TaxID=906968 RepID=F4LIZ1_TREBD|nr:D-alanine--D-alanine ligase family protein [Treponema brennaborense]AEE17300.1 D-alanine--D-alanine ligase [Treponema brennaborense DSM 12168]